MQIALDKISRYERDFVDPCISRTRVSTKTGLTRPASWTHFCSDYGAVGLVLKRYPGERLVIECGEHRALIQLDLHEEPSGTQITVEVVGDRALKVWRAELNAARPRWSR